MDDDSTTSISEEIKLTLVEQGDCQVEEDKLTENGLLYNLDQVPPWYICLFMSLQHVLMFLGSVMAIPLLLSPHLCIEVGKESDDVAKAQLISTTIFVSALVTFLQATLGLRLPIIQGGSAAFLPAAFAILSSHGDCPSVLPAESNITDLRLLGNNLTQQVVISGSAEHQEIWQTRMRSVQGAIIVAGLFEALVGFTGLVGFLLRYIGPLVIAPILTLIGLSLFPVAAEYSSNQWGIALLSVALMILFSQYLSGVKISCSSKSLTDNSIKDGYPIFTLFPVFLTIIIMYIICVVLTYTDVFPNDKDDRYYKARTDSRISVIFNSRWLSLPYPGQWGLPTFTISGGLGMVVAALTSIVQSLGDYYTLARLSGAPPPTAPAINRAIGIEGLGCILMGIFGSGNATTSHSQHVSLIGITRVGSRRVVQVSATIMLLLSMLGKFCAVFVTIPDPILGGVYLIMFGMIISLGLSSLQYINLNSSRNQFILGTSVLMGMAVSDWVKKNKEAIETGSETTNETVRILLGTSMFIGGSLAFFLDSTIPGTLKERGMLEWLNKGPSSDSVQEVEISYEMPCGTKLIRRYKWTNYIPFCPNFLSHQIKQKEKYGS